MPPPLARYFDCVIPWERRLKREMPLLEELARSAGSRVLIPACGTGGHVVALAARGFDVRGFDIDEDALLIAREKIVAASSSSVLSGGKAEVRLLEMARASDLGTQYDIAFVLGNALPGMSHPGQLLAALRGVAGALRPGGIMVTQNLNYDFRWREKTQFFPVLSGQTEDEDVLLVKFADYDEEFINFHAMFLARPRPDGAWQSHIRSSRHVPLFKDRLSAVLTEAGFEGFRFWGDFSRTPFDLAKSNDLVVLAGRQI
jgi:SAM-dependent methyltransferase